MSEVRAYVRGAAGRPLYTGRRYDRVPHSPDLARVLALPRRDPGVDTDEIVDTLTRLFRQPGGEQTMRPAQARAVLELHDCEGAFLPIVASGGKTLPSYLGPIVAQAKRAVLFVPKKLLEETERKFWGPQGARATAPAGLFAHWRGPAPGSYMIQSYEWLSNPNQGAVLSADGKTILRDSWFLTYRPDFLFFDECHKLKGEDNVGRKRVQYYYETARREGWRLTVAAATGTPAKEGLTDYAHILEWCLGERAPVPLDSDALRDWCNALDDKVTEPLRPGALLELCNDEERAYALRGTEEEISAGRQGYRRTFVQTPGIVASQNVKPLHVSGRTLALTFEPLDPGKGDPVLEKWFYKLRAFALTPTDEPVPDKKEEWRHGRELSLGLHYYWDPTPPRYWLEARKAACGWTREALRYCDRYAPWIDSEAKIWDAVQAGRFDDGGLLRAWKDVEPTFTPNPVPAWHSEEAINAAATYLDHNPTGVVWVEHKFFAQRLEAVSGCPYFGELGRDQSGRFILDYKGPCIASIPANYEGRDMQHNWDRALIMTFPQCPVRSEQMLARIHRDGQRTETVRYHVWIGSYAVLAGIDKARQGAQANQDREGGAQRVLYAESTLPTPAEVAKRGGWRWAP